MHESFGNMPTLTSYVVLPREDELYALFVLQKNGLKLTTSFTEADAKP